MSHQKQRFEAQLRKLSLIGTVPLYLLLLWTLIYADVSIWLIILFGFLGSILVLMIAYLIHQRAEYQFRSLTNLLEALTQGEYSMRAVSSQTGGALDELVDTINGLAERLSQQRWEADENQLLVNTIIDHIDVAIIALTEKNSISFLNPAAEKLFLLDSKDSQQKLLRQLDFIQDFSSGYNQVVELSFGQQQGRFNVHIEEFRRTGEQHKLLFISNVTSLLRSEERKAWQSLVRVISHEINNSLSPIASISQTLGRLVKKETTPSGNRDDLLEGLTIIGERATSLSQFVDSYKQLAKLPEPQKKITSILQLVEKTNALFKDHAIEICPSKDLQLNIDPVQLEQVLINL
ncbi:MAG: PAS domain-containing sensor histidine kinase, partial [Kordiimonas sp.]